MLGIMQSASYTFPAMQDASTLLHSSHSHSFVSYGHQDQHGSKQRSHSDDEEMTSCSDVTSGSGSDSFDKTSTSTTPETSLGPDEKINRLQNTGIQADLELEVEEDAVSNQPVVHEDEAMEEDEAEQPSLDLQPKLSEWESQGGLMDINAAFEGSMLFDATLEEISAWCAPLVWKLFLRQEPACSKSHLHRYHLPLDTPCPPNLPKLIIKAMPRYKGGMTRSIAVTHALLYLHRINICFHCNGASRDAIANASGASNSSSTANANTNTKADANGNGNGNGKRGNQDSLKTRIERSFQSTGEDGRISDNAFQCSLFFAVGMHFASLWLLDCCPADIKYWKNYVHCVPASHGIPWFRLVLRQWKYNITVSIEEWLFFSAQVLAKVPFKDELARAQQPDQPNTSNQLNQQLNHISV